LFANKSLVRSGILSWHLVSLVNRDHPVRNRKIKRKQREMRDDTTRVIVASLVLDSRMHDLWTESGTLLHPEETAKMNEGRRSETIRFVRCISMRSARRTLGVFARVFERWDINATQRT